MKYYKKQQGFSLLMVLILMLVIALLVIVTAQSSNTELRMSSNEADRKFALSLAENGLKSAENRIVELSSKKSGVVFNANCNDGLCLPADGTYSNKVTKPFEFGSAVSSANIVAWERCAANPATASSNCPNATVLDEVCRTQKVCRQSEDGGANYIIEYLGTREDLSSGEKRSYFRVTSRARGQNNDTKVTLQSYVELLSL